MANIRIPPELMARREPPAPPPSRYRLGRSGIEWNVGDPMPKEAKRLILIETVLGYAVICSVGFCLVSILLWSMAGQP